MSNYEILQTKLARFVRKYFLNDLIRGAIFFIVFFVLYVFITALIEYFLWLPPHTRKYLYYGILAALVLFFFLFIYKPLLNLLGLKKSLSDEQSAKIIGDFFPEIKDKLLNTLQLHKQYKDSDLLLASIDQKAAKIKSLPFTKAIDFNQSLKYLPLLLLPFLIFLVLKITHLEHKVSQSYQRVLSFNQTFEPPVPFKIRHLSKDSVLEGQDYTLRLVLSGSSIPDALYLMRDDKKLWMKKTNDSVFSFYFPLVNMDINYSIIADKYHFGPYRIKLVYPPVIYQMQVKLSYPSYLHKKNEIKNHTGNFSLPEGTIIDWLVLTKHADFVNFIMNNDIHKVKTSDNKASFSKTCQRDFVYTISPQNKQLKNFEHLSYKISVIKDAVPKIRVEEFKDTINNQFLYNIFGSDDHSISRLQLVYSQEGTGKFNKIDIPIHKADIVQTHFIFPDKISLKQGASYVYYFELFDNDALHHYKSVKSQTFYFNKLTNNELEQKQLRQQKQQLNQLQELNKSFSKQSKQYKKFNESLTQQKALDWQAKQKLQNTIQQAEQQEEFFKESIKKFKRLLDKMPNKKVDETKEDIKKRLDELAKMEKNKKLLDELKKIAEKLKKEDLVKKLKDLDKYSEHQEKSLERILELTKKYYMQQKLSKMSEKLDDLSKKEDALSKQNNDTKKQQDSLNKELNKLQNQADSIQKMNKSLKMPTKLPDIKPDLEDIKNDMQKASEDLHNQAAQSANKKQKKAANKMKKMAKSMQMSMSGGGGDQNEEDIATLQAILKSLINFSYKEEKLIVDLYGNRGKSYLPKQLLSQNSLKTYFKFINDSLYTLALRNPKISQFILDQSFEVTSSLDKTLDNLSQNNYYGANSHAQFILSGSNSLANFLSQALDQMKNAQPSMGSGKGKKGKGFSLPDIIKKQGEMLSKMKEGMKKNGKKPGDKQGDKKGEKKGKKGKKGKNGEQSSGDEGEAKRQYELYKQQQRIKEDLEQLGDRFSDKANKKQISDLAKQMDDLQKRILREGITQSTLNKMIQLQHELLKLKNATFTQHEDEQRQSRTNFKDFNAIDSIFLQKHIQFLKQDELLKRTQIPVNQIIRKKIKDFIKQNEHN